MTIRVSLFWKKALSAFMTVAIVFSCMTAFPKSALADGEVPGTSAYYTARWEDAKTKVGYKNANSSFTNYLGAYAVTTNEGPWMIDGLAAKYAAGTISAPWNGTAVAPTVTTTVTNVSGTSVSAYCVYTAEQYRWCLLNRQSFKLMKNIDLGGYLGRNWTTPATSGTAWVADGNGHTIYNYYCSSSARQQSMYGKTSNVLIKNIRISNSFLNLYVTASASQLGALLICYVSNATLKNCAVEKSISSQAGAGWSLGGLACGLLGSSSIDNCYTNQLYIRCFSTASVSCSSQIAQECTGVTVTNTFSINGAVIGSKGHNGGFTSCCYGTCNYENCFSSVDLYGSTDAGTFVGVTHGGTHTFKKCFSAGKVEGTNRLGGFIGCSASLSGTSINRFENCYSSSLVGITSATTMVGGFYGADNTRFENRPGNATFINCYAAGEVGTISTNSDADRGATDNTVGGFLGVNPTVLALTNCFYDKQTTAMREWESGTAADGSASNLAGLRGMLTSTSAKSGLGMTDSGWNALGSAYNHASGSGYHPQLSAFTNPTTFTNTNWMTPAEMNDFIKAASLASTSTVFLDTWDHDYQGNPLPATTYDTVRDMTAKAPLTNTASVAWERCGVTGAATLATGAGAQTSVFGTNKEVVTLENDPAEGWLVKDPYPGVDWLRATATVNGQTASRAFRICPTNGIYGGVPNTTVNIGTTYDHADDMRMVYTTGARWAANTADMTYGVYPDSPLAAAQSALLSTGGLQNPAALATLYAGAGQNDAYENIDVGNMQRTTTALHSNPDATVTTGNTLNTTVAKATGIDGAGNITYA